MHCNYEIDWRTSCCHELFSGICNENIYDKDKIYHNKIVKTSTYFSLRELSLYRYVTLIDMYVICRFKLNKYFQDDQDKGFNEFLVRKCALDDC